MKYTQTPIMETWNALSEVCCVLCDTLAAKLCYMLCCILLSEHESIRDGLIPTYIPHAMQCVAAGLVKAIGLSNFNTKQITCVPLELIVS